MALHSDPSARSVSARWAAALLLLALLLSSESVAQPALDEHRPQRERERLEFEQRLRSLQRQPLGGAAPRATAPDSTVPGSTAPRSTAPRSNAPRSTAPHSTAPPHSAASGLCWRVTGVRLGGNRLISQARLTGAIEPLLSACLDNAQINQILARITELYAQDGYLASRPQLVSPPHDGHSLDIHITEGFVEAIEVSDPSLPLSLRSALGDMLGRPLQLRTLERGLEQLNRLRGFDLTADIEPGDQLGGSRIVLRPLSRPARWTLGASINNAGKADIGRHQLQASASLDSPLQLNDFIHVSAQQTLADAGAMSRSAGLYYAIPYHAWTFNATASQSHYRLPLPQTQGGHDSHGSSTLLGVGLERSLWRDSQRIVSTSVRLDHKSTDAYLGDQWLGIQSPRLLNAEVGVNLLWLQRGVWTGYLGLSCGLSDWDSGDTAARGARPNTPASSDRGTAHAAKRAPRGRFDKWRGQLGYHTQFPWAGRAWQWQSQLAWQYSDDPLPPLEQLLLTDEYAVRGLRDLSLSGSSAASWRNTLSLKIAAGQGWTLQPHGGIDLGWRRREAYQRASTNSIARARHLAGASLGLSLSDSRTRLSLAYQQPLYLEQAPRPPGYWRFEAIFNL